MSAVPIAGPVAVPRRRTRRRRFLGIAASLPLAALLAFGLWFRQAYPGMASGMWNQMRYGTFVENRNLGRMIAYWIGFMQQLTFEPETGLWTFKHTPTAGLDEFERGRLAFHRGEFGRAVAQIERAVARDGESEERLFWLATSYLRLAEARNCLDRLRGVGGAAGGGAHARAGHHGGADHSLICSLPLVLPHQREEYSRRAAQLFTRLLDRYDDDDPLYRWLLNFSFMTVGGFPGEVPARYRIDTPFVDAFYGEGAARMRRKYGWLRFTDRAQELGIENFGAGRGVAVEDFDRDGDLDVVATGRGYDLTYFRNEGGTRFTALGDEAGISGSLQPFTVSAADFDNDGWIDLFAALPYSQYRLFANDRDGTFTDVTARSGLLDAKPPGALAVSWISTWGDVDNDGDLDLFLANWAFRMPLVKNIMAKPRMDSKLFLNQDGRFRDGSAEYGLHDLLRDRYYIGATFGDYDRDGFADLYLSSPLRGTSVLLRNLGGHRFAPAGDLGHHEPGFVSAFLDVNHDGRLDIYHAGFNDARTSVVQAVFGEHVSEFETGHSTILLQTAGGGFEAHHELFGGGTMPIGTMGSSFGDLNNDGCYDFYLGTGNPEPWFVLPNLMYLGRARDGRCTGEMDNISMLNGFGNVQKGHGIVFFDFDDDGDQDVLSSLGGMWPADRWLSQLFVNESELRAAWTKVRLRGRRTNHYGVGATLAVKAHDAAGRPIVRHHQIDQTTGFGSGPYLAHVGLQDAVALDGIEVYWPASRCRWTYRGELGRLNVLDEAVCLQPPGGHGAARRPAEGRS